MRIYRLLSASGFILFNYLPGKQRKRQQTRALRPTFIVGAPSKTLVDDVTPSLFKPYNLLQFIFSQQKSRNLVVVLAVLWFLGDSLHK